MLQPFQWYSIILHVCFQLAATHSLLCGVSKSGWNPQPHYVRNHLLLEIIFYDSENGANARTNAKIEYVCVRRKSISYFRFECNRITAQKMRNYVLTGTQIFAHISFQSSLSAAPHLKSNKNREKCKFSEKYLCAAVANPTASPFNARSCFVEVRVNRTTFAHTLPLYTQKEIVVINFL